MSSLHLTGILLGIIAAAVSAFIIALILRTPVHLLFVDKPDPRKVHQRPVPRAGGVGIILGFVAVLVGAAVVHVPLLDTGLPLLRLLLVAAGVLLVVGGIDDLVIVNVRVRHKLVAEVALAAVVVFVFDMHFGPIALAPGVWLPAWVGIGLSLVWIVGVINAVNIIDGIDGLAGGVSLICFLAVGILAGFNAMDSAALVCAIIGGACLGFLLYNFSPARIFMGDAGALFLGSALAVLSMHVAVGSRAQPSLLVAFLLVGLPVLDVFVAMVRRFMSTAVTRRLGVLNALKALTVADNSHIHHRLVYQGLTHGQSCLLLYVVTATMAIAAIGVTEVGLVGAGIILAYLAVYLILILDRFDFGARFRRMIGMQPREWYHPVEGTVVAGVFGIDNGIGRYLAEYDGAEVTFVEMPQEGVRDTGAMLDVLLFFVGKERTPEAVVENATVMAQVTGRPAIVLQEPSARVPAEAVDPGTSNVFLIPRPGSVYTLIGTVKSIASPAKSERELAPDEVESVTRVAD
ncbi:MAG: hypothetical protein GF331_19955 [Chitinivibrionales bacterium]|nr:hypothetical protein [Chitinivibrionales bacterium]